LKTLGNQTTFVIRAPEPVALASDWERANAPQPPLIEGKKPH
jgi:hypothetical protein